MPDNPTTQTRSASETRVLAALIPLGQATAATIADTAGLAYSTTTPKLRALESAGLAEPVHVDGRTLWRATAAASHGEPDHPAADSTGADSSDAAGQDNAPAEPAHQDHPAADPQEPAPADAPEARADDPTADDRADDDRANTGDMPDDTAADEPEVFPDTTGDGDGSTPTADDTPDQPEPDQADDAPEPVDPAADGGQPPTGLEDTAPPTPSAGTDTGTRPRRARNAYRDALLAVLETHPDQQFTVTELCRAVNAAADPDTGMVKATYGAAANSLFKLAAAGCAIQTSDRPVRFQLTPPPPSGDGTPTP